jgi:hypothetical protein
VIEYSDTSFEDIISLGLIDKVNNFIANDSGDNIIYTEYVIELFYNLMTKINDQKKIITSMNLDREEFKVK